MHKKGWLVIAVAAWIVPAAGDDAKLDGLEAVCLAFSSEEAVAWENWQLAENQVILLPLVVRNAQHPGDDLNLAPYYRPAFDESGNLRPFNWYPEHFHQFWGALLRMEFCMADNPQAQVMPKRLCYFDIYGDNVTIGILGEVRLQGDSGNDDPEPDKQGLQRAGVAVSQSKMCIEAKAIQDANHSYQRIAGDMNRNMFAKFTGAIQTYLNSSYDPFYNEPSLLPILTKELCELDQQDEIEHVSYRACAFPLGKRLGLWANATVRLSDILKDATEEQCRAGTQNLDEDLPEDVVADYYAICGLDVSGNGTTATYGLLEQVVLQIGDYGFNDEHIYLRGIVNIEGDNQPELVLKRVGYESRGYAAYRITEKAGEFTLEEIGTGYDVGL